MAGPKDMPTSKLGRMARLGGLSSRVSGSYLGQRIAGVFQDEDTRQAALRRLHLQNAERVVDTMSVLKGAAMKVGQYASVAAEALDLPEDVGRVFRKLTHQAEPIPFATIRAEIEASLDAGLDTLFDRFDPEPLGTASLGQAHAAWLPDGTPVVVKVLHRGIDQAVDADLSALRTMLLAGGMVGRRKEDLDPVFDEIRARLRDELDYYQEAANLEFFAKAFAVDPDVRVPRSVPSHSSERVLTMDRLVGMPVEAFADQAGPEARHRAGAALARTFHHSFYRLHALQADPHQGNYLVTREGQVGLIDFGCVRRFDPHWVHRYARFARGLFAGAREETLDHLVALEVIDADAPESSRDRMWRLCDVIAGPFRLPHFVAGGPDDRLVELLRPMGAEVALDLHLHLPRELVFLDRSLMGTYLMLRTLRFGTDYGGFVLPYVEEAIEVAEGRARPSTSTGPRLG
jgi:predicted unusual protein kinase regulating ubiquinone biosynthesis (AarF/ABC1/UbiB family)